MRKENDHGGQSENSFKIAPDYFVVVKPMAAGQHESVSEFVRETVEQALQLERKAERLAALLAEGAPEAVRSG